MPRAPDHETWPASTPRIGGFRAPYGWRMVRIERLGPFPVRVVWELPDGSQRAWESRGRRLRKELATVPSVLLGATARVRPPLVAWAPQRLVWWVGVAYVLGCLLVLVGELGAAGAGLPSPSTAVSCYLGGASAFLAGNYLQFLSVSNGRDHVGADQLRLRHLRWLSWQPRRLDYLISVVFLAGSVAFTLEALAALAADQGWFGVPSVIGPTTLVGSVLFVVATASEALEIRPGRPWWNPRSLPWWSAILSLAGSASFLVGATGVLAGSSTGSPRVDIPYLVGPVLFLGGSYALLAELSSG